MTNNPIHLIQLTDLHLCETPGDILGSGVNTDEMLCAVLKQNAARKQLPELLVARGIWRSSRLPPYMSVYSTIC